MEIHVLADRLQVDTLLRALGDENTRNQEAAREQILAMGESALPLLRQGLDSENQRVRCEAVRALCEVGGVEAAGDLVYSLGDEDEEVRGLAVHGLARLGRAGIQPLLAALTRDEAIHHLRDGAFRVMDELKDHHQLAAEEVEVWRALSSSSPALEVPWTAWEALRNFYI